VLHECNTLGDSDSVRYHNDERRLVSGVIAETLLYLMIFLGCSQRPPPLDRLERDNSRTLDLYFAAFHINVSFFAHAGKIATP
jgi:hypothetical protein